MIRKYTVNLHSRIILKHLPERLTSIRSQSSIHLVLDQRSTRRWMRDWSICCLDSSSWSHFKVFLIHTLRWMRWRGHDAGRNLPVKEYCYLRTLLTASHRVKESSLLAGRWETDRFWILLPLPFVQMLGSLCHGLSLLVTQAQDVRTRKRRSYALGLSLASHKSRVNRWFVTDRPRITQTLHSPSPANIGWRREGEWMFGPKRLWSSKM